MIAARRYVLAFLSLFLTIIAPVSLAKAQRPDLHPGYATSPTPIVSFEFERPGMRPPHYAISVESTGKAAYRADEVVGQDDSSQEPYILKFTVSEPNRSRIFELAQQTNFFKGNFNYTKTRIADTGTKTLMYSEGGIPDVYTFPVEGVLNRTTYNWSENPAIQQLTSIFQGIETTLEFGRRLEFDRRFDKLALDSELKQLQEMQKGGQALEIQAIAPVLTNISNDFSVMHIARQRAQQILKAAQPK
jgi:hypothetical protein